MLATAVLVIVAAGGAWWLRADRSPSSDAQSAWSPLPRRVKVEVLNAGSVVGAARVATQLLRHGGLDVVASGNSGSALGEREHTQVLVRGTDTVGLGRVIEVLGSADVVHALEPTRLVDLTVLLGKDFAPPPDRVRPGP